MLKKLFHCTGITLQKDKFTIILKDIVERLGIKDIASFNKVLQYILDTESREFSRDNIIEFLRKEYK